MDKNRIRLSSCLNFILGVILACFVGTMVLLAGSRPLYLNAGATRTEIEAVLPGDEHIFDPRTTYTRAVLIAASPRQIWPWLVQLGAGRGGWYSYTWIERLLGCPVENADSIHPEWQDLQAGDLVYLCPDTDVPPPYTVIHVQPEQALVLGHPLLDDAGQPVPGEWRDTWTMVLQPENAAWTRLIVRGRSATEDRLMRLLEPGIWFMELGMMRGIKSRAE